MAKRNDRSLNRRVFLKTASAAALGAAGAFGVVPRSLSAAGDNLTVNGLPASILGRTGLKVTKISFGGVMVTEPPVLLSVIDQGINLVHTSPGYQNGRSMEAFGKAFKKKGVRNKVVFALKERPEKIDECMKVLNIDYVDILVPPLTSLGAIDDPELRENFEKVKKAGKAGFMGYAGHSNMVPVLNRARELGWYDAALMNYSNVNDPEFQQAVKKANQAGMGIFTMKGLPKRNATGADREEAETVTSLCSAMLNKQHAHSVLASMGSFQSVEFYRNLLEKDLAFSNPGLEERYWAAQQGNYCSMCGACSGICPEQGENIQRLLRYRMYHKDYGLSDYARVKYSRLAAGAKGISDHELALCESVCSRHLPLRKMVSEARTILA